jgi:hypothetical protein
MDETSYNQELIEAVEILKSKRIIKKDAEIAEKTNFPRSSVSSYLNGKIKASRNFINKFLEVYGSHFANNVLKGLNEPVNKIAAAVESAKQILSKPIPFYDIDVSASNVAMFSDTPEIPSSAISIPGFDDCDFGLPVWGHSMYPTYENGTIVLCKKISDMEIIRFGEAYLIVTSDDQRFIKRLLKADDKKHVVCSSDNTDARDRNDKRRYENFELPKSKIRHMYIIKGAIKRSQI